MIKVKHLVWIIGMNALFSLLNLGIQANFIISLAMYSSHTASSSQGYTYSPSNFLFNEQEINIHCIIFDMIVDCFIIIANSIILILLYKKPYTLKIYKLQVVNYVFVLLKLIFSIASHIQNTMSFSLTNVQKFCNSSDSSAQSTSACNLVFSEKFFVVFLYISIFFSLCSIFAFRFYYNIFITQPQSAQSPIAMDLQVPFSDVTDSNGGKKSKQFSASTPSYLTNMTTKKSSGKLDPQTIQDLEMTLQQSQLKSTSRKKTGEFSPLQRSPHNPFKSSVIGNNDSNFFSNQVRAIELNPTNAVLQTQNIFTSSLTKLQTEGHPSENSQNEPEQVNQESGSCSLYMFNKKNKANPQMERPSLRVTKPPNDSPWILPQNAYPTAADGQRGSIYSQRSSIGLSSIPFPSSNFSRSNTNQSQGLASICLSSQSPKRFSLSLYKCANESTTSPIKVFNRVDQMQSSIILDVPALNNACVNLHTSALSDCYDESTYECYSPTINPAHPNNRNAQMQRSPRNHDNLVIDNQNLGLGLSQNVLALRKGESEQIYEESDESDQSNQTNSLSNSSSFDQSQYSDHPQQPQNQKEEQNHVTVPNKYFRTDKTKLNPLALAPSAAIIGHKISSAAASHIINVVDNTLKSNPNGNVNPLSNMFSRVFNTLLK